jgi:hypothetical protein
MRAMDQQVVEAARLALEAERQRISLELAEEVEQPRSRRANVVSSCASERSSTSSR